MGLKDKTEAQIKAYRRLASGQAIGAIINLTLTYFHQMALWLGVLVAVIAILNAIRYLRVARKLQRTLNDPLFYLLAVKHDLNGK